LFPTKITSLAFSDMYIQLQFCAFFDEATLWLFLLYLAANVTF
jgi:hypothetical protein